MRLIKALSTLLIAVPALHSNGSVAAAEVAPGTAQYQGCYRLTLSPWNPPIRGGGFAPPSAIELTGTAVTRNSQLQGFAVRPALGAPAGRLGANWNVLPIGRITIEWFDGFNGLGMLLERKGSSLIGTAEVFHDLVEDGTPPEKAEVRADKVPCDPTGATSSSVSSEDDTARVVRHSADNLARDAAAKAALGGAKWDLVYLRTDAAGDEIFITYRMTARPNVTNLADRYIMSSPNTQTVAFNKSTGVYRWAQHQEINKFLDAEKSDQKDEKAR